MNTMKNIFFISSGNAAIPVSDITDLKRFSMISFHREKCHLKNVAHLLSLDLLRNESARGTEFDCYNNLFEKTGNHT